MTDDKYTNANFTLDVGDGHQLHVIDWGDKAAKTPFIFLHGGPGGRAKDKQKSTFDPTIHRVIFFDQRGCGESTPYGSLNHNTTQDLAGDITKIADHLHIDKFNLYGYSWGSTLALYYAIQHPEKVQNLIIGGVYSGANDFSEMLNSLHTFYPEVYAEVLAEVPTAHHNDPAAYLQSQAIKGTPEEQKRAAYLTGRVEGTIMSYGSDLRTPEPYEDYDPVPALIETHYIANSCFLPEADYLLNHATEITAPTYIVQGRSDLVCPPKFAYEISQKIPHAKLFWSTSNHYSDHETLSLFRTILNML